VIVVVVVMVIMIVVVLLLVQQHLFFLLSFAVSFYCYRNFSYRITASSERGFPSLRRTDRIDASLVPISREIQDLLVTQIISYIYREICHQDAGCVSAGCHGRYASHCT
jgi:hypothetical protein